MKNRLLLFAILAVGATALYFGLVRPQVSSIPTEITAPMADLKPVPPPPIEPPALVMPAMPTFTPPPIRPNLRVDPILGRPEVPIQPNATIDFSTGSPVVKTFGKDKEELEKAMKEIAEAVKDVSFEAKK